MSLNQKQETDVIVVGGGGAGLAAALEAARCGCDVVLLEKMPTLMGSTGLSVGSITATRTALQKRAGIDDTADEHFADMALFAEDAQPVAARTDNLELRRLLVDNVSETVRQLEELGIVFFGPMPEPPHKKPRMHNVLPHARSYIYHLAKACRRAGVLIQTGARVTGLKRDEDRITGIAYEANGAPVDLLARRGVVLAAGDYSSGRELKQRFAGDEVAGVEGINPDSTGDGHQLGLKVGAQMAMGQVVLGPEIRFVAPPEKKLLDILPPLKPVAQLVKLSMDLLPSWILRPFLMMFVTTHLAPTHKLFEEGAVLVNKLGQRFSDEMKEPQSAVPYQPDGEAFFILDDAIAKKFGAWPNFISTAPGIAYAYLPDYRRNRRDIYANAPTVEDLARRIGVPPDALRRTLEAHNADVPNSQEKSRPALATPPFHALGPAKSWIVITDGGLKVSTRLEVLDADGTPIPGLYAAGSNGQGGLLLEGHGHHLGWAFTSGRLAGRYAAAGTDGNSQPAGNRRPTPGS